MSWMDKSHSWWKDLERIKYWRTLKQLFSEINQFFTEDFTNKYLCVWIKNFSCSLIFPIDLTSVRATSMNCVFNSIWDTNLIVHLNDMTLGIISIWHLVINKVTFKKFNKSYNEGTNDAETV